MSKISANERAGRHVRFDAIMPTYTSGQPEDMNAVCDLGCVVETPLSVTPGGSPEVIGCVASQIPEDFTALLEMHPLKHKTSLTTTIQKVHILQQQHSMQIATLIGKRVRSVKSWAGWDSPCIHLGAM